MIKSNDIRIGNIINDISSGFTKTIIVTAKVINKIDNGAGKDYEPVTLTTDILSNMCGFECILNSIIHRRNDYYKDGFGTLCIYNDSEVIFNINGISVTIKYLHELQNLYLDITKNELINPSDLYFH